MSARVRSPRASFPPRDPGDPAVSETHDPHAAIAAEVVPVLVLFDSVDQDGRRIEFDGTAESSTRVSALMRNIEASPWLEDPGLEVVETTDEDGVRRSRFTVSARQIDLAPAEESKP